MYKYVCVLIWLLSTACTAVQAQATDTLEEKRQALDTLKKELSVLSKTLTQKRAEQDVQQHALATLETSLGHYETQLATLKKNLKNNHVILNKIQQTRHEQLNKLAALKQHAKKGLQYQYIHAQQHPLKMILTQENIPTLQRNIRMNQYLAHTALKRVEALDNTYRHLIELKAAAEEKNRTLQKLIKEITPLQARLKVQYTKRGILLKKIAHNIEQATQRKQHLMLNKAALEKVIAHLQTLHIPSALSALTDNTIQPFNTMQGTLPWPVASSHHPEITLNQNLQQNAGRIFKVTPGTPVKAVYAGTIIFADWLRGYGLLIIVDHGNGYMSLYGHNQNFYKQPGDAIEAGDIIATAGTSGGYAQPGVYFELRKDGKPLALKNWLSPVAL